LAELTKIGQLHLNGLRYSLMKSSARISTAKLKFAKASASHYPGPGFNQCEQLWMDEGRGRFNIFATHEPTQQAHSAR
jgi:hypothetical protein